MSEAKHTPGPWKSTYKRSRYEITGTGGQLMIHLHGNQINAEGNAQLIATSPEMLYALRVAENAIEQLCHGQDAANECWNTLSTIRNTIAKAEGRS